MKLSFRIMARFTYPKSCYERLGYNSSIVQDRINHSLKLSIAIATNTGGT